MIMADLRAPMPWFGGKSSIAPLVWSRFGDVRNFVDPFCGSCSILLGRPMPFRGAETVNDVNGWLTNLWRSIQFNPDETAKHADWIVSELDIHARGDALFYRDDWYKARGYESVRSFIEWLRADPAHHDPLIAGWWVWGVCSWIGEGWGPRKPPNIDNASMGVSRRRPHLHGGMGVNRKLPHLGDAGMGVKRQRPHLSTPGMGVNRQRPHLGDVGIGDDESCGEGREPWTAKGRHLRAYLRGLAERMRCVRVCCGDWSRVCGPTPTVKQGLTAVFLDPPYAVKDRADCYNDNEDRQVAHAVREWAIEKGEDRRIRLALCGYEGEHVMPDSWECVHWETGGGYGNRSANGKNSNSARERIWFSPYCVPSSQRSLF